MPKMKINKTAVKRFKINRKGLVKRAQAGTSHNTAKKSAKRIRNLRKIIGLDKTNEEALKRLLPYRTAR
jgi:large subunit ribosomal protein L35